MLFSSIKEIIIPEGRVTKITNGNIILWQGRRLPTEYQEVEYIQAPDKLGCYIDLGFTFDTSARVQLSQYITTPTNSIYGYPFGAAESSGAIRCMLSNPYSNNGGASAYGSNGTAYLLAVASVKANSFNDFEITLKKGALTLSNATTGATSTNKSQAEYTMQSNLYLFAQNYNGSARFGVDRTIRTFKYYDKNDTLICNLIPCYRKADNIPGMYDTVRKIFLTNAGSGSFIVGPDVLDD